MPDSPVNNQVTTASTQPPKEDGGPNEHKQIIKRKKLYILSYYSKSGEDTFKRAARFKKKRLQEKYSDAVYWVKSFTSVEDFKKVWKEVYQATTGEKALYFLVEFHYFGHSSPHFFYFLGGKFGIEDIPQIEILTFDAQDGALILHSCLSSMYEEQKQNTQYLPNIKKEQDKKSCIAHSFANYLKVKTIGQVVKANFNTGDTEDDFKYRSYSWYNKVKVDWVGKENLVLWGYNAGKAVDSKHLGSKETIEHSLLADYQLFPARGFEKDGNETVGRIVQSDVFNALDLKYI